MECYKKLNEELIKQIYVMKEEIALYRKAINEINGQYFNERSLRVEQKQYFRKILAENYQNMLKKLQDDVDQNNDCKNSCSNPDILSHERRNSEEILENIRYSEECQKMRTLSPILRKSNSFCYDEDISNMMENAVSSPNSLIIHNSLQFHISSSTIEEQIDENQSNEMDNSCVELNSDDSFQQEQGDNELSNETSYTDLHIKINKLNLLNNIKEAECDFNEIPTETSCENEEPAYNTNINLGTCEEKTLKENTLGEFRERPQRSCRPLNLKETNLRTKMRNESCCSLGKTKKKIQSKKII